MRQSLLLAFFWKQEVVYYQIPKAIKSEGPKSSPLYGAQCHNRSRILVRCPEMSHTVVDEWRRCLLFSAKVDAFPPCVE